MLEDEPLDLDEPELPDEREAPDDLDELPDDREAPDDLVGAERVGADRVRVGVERVGAERVCVARVGVARVCPERDEVEPTLERGTVDLVRLTPLVGDVDREGVRVVAREVVPGRIPLDLLEDRAADPDVTSVERVVLPGRRPLVLELLRDMVDCVPEPNVERPLFATERTPEVRPESRTPLVDRVAVVFEAELVVPVRTTERLPSSIVTPRTPALFEPSESVLRTPPL